MWTDSQILFNPLQQLITAPERPTYSFVKLQKTLKRFGEQALSLNVTRSIICNKAEMDLRRWHQHWAETLQHVNLWVDTFTAYTSEMHLKNFKELSSTHLWFDYRYPLEESMREHVGWNAWSKWLKVKRWLPEMLKQEKNRKPCQQRNWNKYWIPLLFGKIDMFWTYEYLGHPQREINRCTVDIIFSTD